MTDMTLTVNDLHRILTDLIQTGKGDHTVKLRIDCGKCVFLEGLTTVEWDNIPELGWITLRGE